MIRKSRYTFLVNRDDTYLIYSSARNSFWSVSKYVYDLVENFDNLNGNEEFSEEVEGQIAKLHSLGIISTEEEDDRIVNKLRLRRQLKSFSTDCIGLTLLPTMACNLNCPYCFEHEKNSDCMTEETMGKVVDFIKSHESANSLDLTWFGGEPMVAYKVMEPFLDKIHDLERIKLVRHGMVTNGTLLTEERWGVFEKYPLNYIQITLDGNKETHDKKRIRHDGTGTYDEITSNMKAFVEKFPKTSLSVRVNIDRNNACEFMQVYNDLKEIFGDKKNLYIYPGILSSCGGKVEDTPFLNNKEAAELRNDFVRKGYPTEYPRYVLGGCTATNISSYVIGPKGEIYKCWEDVGDPKWVVGNVTDKKYTNEELLEDYLLFGSNINDPNCWKCPMLPVCENICARRRIEKLCFGANNELCNLPNEKAAMEDMLYEYYKAKQNGSLKGCGA